MSAGKRTRRSAQWSARRANQQRRNKALEARRVRRLLVTLDAFEMDIKAVRAQLVLDPLVEP